MKQYLFRKMAATALVAALAGIGFFTTPACAAVQATYYVSPYGSDANAGDSAHPFLTIVKARDMVRAIRANMTGDIVVYLRCGTHRIASPIQFGISDGGTNGYKIMYMAFPGESPVLSGGELVTGWTVHSGNIYKATLGRNTKLRNLYVNGKRVFMAELSRKPMATATNGTMTIAGTEPWAQTSGTEFTGLLFPKDSMPVVANPSDVEIEWWWQWCFEIVGLQNMLLSGTSTLVVPQQPLGAIAASLRWGWLGVNSQYGRPYPYTVRNAMEYLTKPGYFYFNRVTGTLYYYSNGENMSTATVVAPLSRGLIKIQGTDTTQRVKNLVFKGITFMHDHYLLDSVANSRGFIGSQSTANFYKYRTDGDHCKAQYTCEDIPQSAIFASNADSLRIEQCKFLSLGSAIAVNLENGVVNSVVKANVFRDLSGAAINVSHPQHWKIGDGPKYAGSTEGVCRNDTLNDNFIRGIGVEFKRVEAISSYHTALLTITHNDVQNVPWDGIANGWHWGSVGGGIAASTIPTANKITYNRVGSHHQYLFDGGGIYVMGNSPGSEITGNYVYNGESQLMLDEGAQWWTTKTNVCQTPTLQWLHIWSTATINCTVDNNYTNTAATLNWSNIRETNTHLESTVPAWPGTTPAWSAAAQAIINFAGIETAYATVKTDTLAPVECPPPVGILPVNNPCTLQPFKLKLLGSSLALPGEFAGKRISVAIVDLNGKTVMQLTSDKSGRVAARSTAGLAKGTYVVRCGLENRVISQAMVNCR